MKGGNRMNRLVRWRVTGIKAYSAEEFYGHIRNENYNIDETELFVDEELDREEVALLVEERLYNRGYDYVLVNLKEAEETFVSISQHDYNQMLELSHIARALENSGVEEWEGYDEALENYALMQDGYRCFENFINNELNY